MAPGPRRSVHSAVPRLSRGTRLAASDALEMEEAEAAAVAASPESAGVPTKELVTAACRVGLSRAVCSAGHLRKV